MIDMKEGTDNEQEKDASSSSTALTSSKARTALAPSKSVIASTQAGTKTIATLTSALSSLVASTSTSVLSTTSASAETPNPSASASMSRAVVVGVSDASVRATGHISFLAFLVVLVLWGSGRLCPRRGDCDESEDMSQASYSLGVCRIIALSPDALGSGVDIRTVPYTRSLSSKSIGEGNFEFRSYRYDTLQTIPEGPRPG